MRSLTQFADAWDAIFPGGAPLFLLQDGSPFSRHFINVTLRAALGPGFSSHSLRIGIATSVCEAGVDADDTVISQLERWSSEAFHGYVRCPRPAVRRTLRLVSAQTVPTMPFGASGAQTSGTRPFRPASRSGSGAPDIVPSPSPARTAVLVVVLVGQHSLHNAPLPQ